MKRGFMLLLVSLVLAIGLTACGGETMRNDDTLMDDAQRGVSRTVRGAENAAGNAVNDVTGYSGNQQVRTQSGWSGAPTGIL